MEKSNGNKNYNFYINSDLSSHSGKWIAIINGKIAAIGDRAGTVIKKVKKKYLKKKYLLSKVPEEGLLVLSD